MLAKRSGFAFLAFDTIFNAMWRARARLPVNHPRVSWRKTYKNYSYKATEFCERKATRFLDIVLQTNSETFSSYNLKESSVVGVLSIIGIFG